MRSARSSRPTSGSWVTKWRDEPQFAGVSSRPQVAGNTPEIEGHRDRHGRARRLDCGPHSTWATRREGLLATGVAVANHVARMRASKCVLLGVLAILMISGCGSGSGKSSASQGPLTIAVFQPFSGANAIFGAYD